MIKPLLVATHNAHKTREFREILGHEWLVEDLAMHPDFIAPEESGRTFEENARIKAESASEFFDKLVLSDDSGLEVDALGGSPGVLSARYSGVHGKDAANRSLLIERLNSSGIKGPWGARFRCAIAIAYRGRTLAVVDGCVEGHVIDREIGNKGFGYDSLFIPRGYSITFGELPSEHKKQISHRAAAISKAVSKLVELESHFDTAVH